MEPYGHNQATKTGGTGDGFPDADIVSNTADAAIIWICDLHPKSLERVRRTCRVVGISTNPDDLLDGPSEDAVAIVVPASHRFQL